MRVGRVIGKVTLSKQDPAYKGGRFLLVSPMGKPELAAAGETRLSEQPSVVVYDERGAGIDEMIGFVEGPEATAPFERPIPIDAYNVAILDTLRYQP